MHISLQKYWLKLFKISPPCIVYLCSNITVLLNYYCLIRTTNENMNLKSRLKSILIYHIFNAPKKECNFLWSFPILLLVVLQQYLVLNISNEVRYKVICKDIYESLTISDLDNMKLTIRNYFEVTLSKFIRLCFNCMYDIHSKLDVNN